MVKVVTDSTSDIPTDVLQDLCISVVPLYVVFGDKTYRDRVDIREEDFYRRLTTELTLPTTSVPPPQDFADVYNRLADETDEIISIHLTAKESGTYNSARLGRDLVRKKCRVEVVDSQSISMACGLLAMAAAREAMAGRSLDQVTEIVRRSLHRTHILFMVDTLKYVVRGGRIGKAQGMLGSVLGVKPLLTMRDGDLSLSGVARTRARAVQRLFDFARGYPRLTEAAVPYTTNREAADKLAEDVRRAFPGAAVHVTRVGPALGTHAGPDSMGMVVMEGVDSK
ncbi:MAG: DegV family protein [Chloroflexi bacterium]|nr:DegV family protein [Chloroflexota bacterium]